MTSKKDTKVKKYPLKPHSAAWEKEARKLALSLAPDIISCKDCGAPVVEGYCCGHCGSTSPR
jgi:hypothetical protein